MNTFCTVNDVMEEIGDVLKNNILMTKEKQNLNINNCFSELNIIDDIAKSINNFDAKSILNEAQNDLLNSILFACQGFYRNSHICLRSTLELTLNFVYYYDHHYDFVLWKADYVDMTWSKLMNTEQGVFNKNFYKLLFGRNVNLDKLISEIKDLYHLCSQSVHGKYEYMQTNISSAINYNHLAFENYYRLFKSVINIVKAVLYLRFKDDIKTKLNPDDINILDIILSKFEV